MEKLTSEIIINAPVSEVWEQLTDFEEYKMWNPFINTISGSLKKGANLTVKIKLEGQKEQVFKPEILKLENEKEFRWLGHLFIKGLFDGEHYFKLEPISKSQTRLIHGENFSGLLSKVIYKMIGEQTLEGFRAMNHALKERVEKKLIII